MRLRENSDEAIEKGPDQLVNVMITLFWSRVGHTLMSRWKQHWTNLLGLLDLYEASGKEEYISWAIRLQEKQDELFYDREGGGYFVSAPDEHIIVRMKDVQVGRFYLIQEHPYSRRFRMVQSPVQHRSPCPT